MYQPGEPEDDMREREEEMERMREHVFKEADTNGDRLIRLVNYNVRVEGKGSVLQNFTEMILTIMIITILIKIRLESRRKKMIYCKIFKCFFVYTITSSIPSGYAKKCFVG